MEMQEKPKSRSRSKTVPAETAAPAKPRKSRSRKSEGAAAPEISPIPVVDQAPVLAAVPVPAVDRQAVTVPLPQLADYDTTELINENIISYDTPATSVPRQLVCQQIEAAYLSDVGRVRTNNEDSASAFLSTVSRLEGGSEIVFGFLALADGMGGHERGEVASNLAVRRMNEGVMQFFYLPVMEGTQPGRPGESPLDILRDLVMDANSAILQEAHSNRVSSMGTTLTCAVLVGQTAFVAHVGDSRLYVLEKSTRQLKLITKDHSVVQRLVDAGTLTLEEAANSPQRSMLYKSLGQRLPVEPDVEILSLYDVEYLLLCSDGLWDMVEDPDIEHILQTAQSPADASSKLVQAANAAGGADNVTVVVARF